MSVAVKYFAEHWTETSSAKYSLQFSFMPSLSLFTSLSHLKLGAKWFKLSEISIAARFMDNSMDFFCTARSNT